MKYEKRTMAMIPGRYRNKIDNPSKEAIYHPELGTLMWSLQNGDIVICKSYCVYRLEQINKGAK